MARLRVACSGTCLAMPQFRYVDNSVGTVTPYLRASHAIRLGELYVSDEPGAQFPGPPVHFRRNLGSQRGRRRGRHLCLGEHVRNQQYRGLRGSGGYHRALIDPTGENPKIYPCFEHSTMADLLTASHHLAIFYAPSAGSIWTARPMPFPISASRPVPAANAPERNGPAMSIWRPRMFCGTSPVATCAPSVG